MALRDNIIPYSLVRGQPINFNSLTTFNNEFKMGPGIFTTVLRFYIDLTVGTASGPITNGILNFMRRIYYKTSAGEVLVDNQSARQLLEWAVALSGCVPLFDQIAASSATYIVEIPVYHCLPSRVSVRPADTILDTSDLDGVELQIETGPMSDLFTTPGTATATVTCDIDVVQSRRKWDRSKAGVVGFLQYANRKPVDASSKTDITLERADDLTVMMMMIHASTSGNSDVPMYGTNSDAIIDRLSLDSSSDNFCFNAKWSDMQAQNKRHFSLESIRSGIVILDYIRDRSLKSGIYMGPDPDTKVRPSPFSLSWTNQAGVGANSFVTLSTLNLRDLRRG